MIPELKTFLCMDQYTAEAAFTVFTMRKGRRRKKGRRVPFFSPPNKNSHDYSFSQYLLTRLTSTKLEAVTQKPRASLATNWTLTL